MVHQVETGPAPSVSTDLAASEDGLRCPISPNTFEWWYFDAIFDDGSTCVLNFITKDKIFVESPIAPTFQFNIGLPDGTYKQSVITYAADAISAASDHCQVRIGPNRVDGDLHTYQIHAEGDGMAADLTFTRVVPGFRVGPVLTPDETAKQWLGEQVVIPSGTATGTLTYEGQTHQVTGTCYHDHQWGAAPPAPPVPVPSPLDYWYWGRFRVGQYSVVFAEIFPKAEMGGEAAALKMFIMGQNDQLVALESDTLHVVGTQQAQLDGRAYSKVVELDWSARGNSVHGVFTNPKLIADFGDYLRFIADLTLDVTWDGQSSTQTGRGIWEIMYLD